MIESEITPNQEKNPTPKITLEDATEGDEAVFLDLGERLKSKTFVPVTDFGKEMSRGPVYMIKREGETVGATSYRREPDGSIYINNIVVDPAHQGGGIGREAMLQILDRLKDEPKIWLVTHPDNKAAVNLYESLGFKVTAKKENYFGNGEPRLVMEKIKGTEDIVE